MSDQEWRYQGMVLPRGCVVHGKATPEDLRRLAEAHTCRCAEAPTHNPARAAADAAYLQAFCEYLISHGFNAMGTATFCDRVAYKRYILSPLKAVQVVSQAIRHDVPFGDSRGFRGKLFVTPEWHRTGREVPHVHFALKTTTVDPDTCCKRIRSHLSETFGRSTCEVMRDVEAATLYGLKDTLKETGWFPGAYYLSLRERGR